MSLYQKYRPKDFNSLVWQDFIKIALQNAIMRDRLVGAYLFYGSRGTGKTTTARILAKAVNCLNITKDGNPCGICSNCEAFMNWELIDIIEIDAASNTWVDNIRELIEKAQFQPNYGKFKVYIIDEVHMLSKWAFNALLKTLEEPPKHVKFILATTEIHKIPETIISRTQRFDFKKITETDIVNRLEFIAKEELIKTEKTALELIARLSRGWLRDAITLFEQYSIWDNLKLDYLKDNLQLVWDEFLNWFIENIEKKNNKWVLENLSFLKNKWIDVKIFLEEITYFLHDKILNSLESDDFNTLVNIYDLFIEIYSKIKLVPNSFLLLEFSILKNLNLKTIPKEIVINEPKKIEEVIKAPEKKEIKKEVEEVIIKVEKEEEFKAEKPKEIKSDKKFELTKLLEEMKKDAGKWFLMMSIKSSKVSCHNWEVNIYANNDFNYDKMNAIDSLSYLKDKIKQVFDIDDINIKKNTLLWEISDVF